MTLLYLHPDKHTRQESPFPARLVHRTEQLAYDDNCQVGSDVLERFGLTEEAVETVTTDPMDLDLSLRPHDVAAALTRHAAEHGLRDLAAPEQLISSHGSGIVWANAAGEIVFANTATTRVLQKAYGSRIRALQPEYYGGTMDLTRAELDDIIAQKGMARGSAHHVHVVDGHIAQHTELTELMQLFDTAQGHDGKQYGSLARLAESPTFELSSRTFGELTELRITEVFNPQDLLRFNMHTLPTGLQKNARALQAHHEEEQADGEIPLPHSDIGEIIRSSVDPVTFHRHPIVWINLDTGKLMRINAAFKDAAQQAIQAQHMPEKSTSLNGSRALRELAELFHLSVDPQILQDELAQWVHNKELNPATASHLLAGFDAHTDTASWQITARLEGRILEFRFEPGTHVQKSRKTIVFTDIVDSMKMHSRLGDRMNELVQEYLTGVQSIVQRCRGEFLKSTGDGALMSFDNPVDAVHAIEQLMQITPHMNESLEKHEHLQTRIGGHYSMCDVTRKEDSVDVYGRDIGITQRCESKAAEGSAAISTELYDVPGVRQAVGEVFDTRMQHVHSKGVGYHSIMHLTPKKEATATVIPFGR